MSDRDRDVCAAHGCPREPSGTSRFCQRHLQPTADLCRRVWRALTQAQEPGTRHVQCSLHELAEQLGSHKSTVWRAILTLERLGYVRRVGQGQLIVLVGFGEVTHAATTEPV